MVTHDTQMLLRMSRMLFVGTCGGRCTRRRNRFRRSRISEKFAGKMNGDGGSRPKGGGICLFQRDQLVDEVGVVFLFDSVCLLVVLVDFRGVVHRAEFRSAHRAERGFLVVLVGKSLVVHGAGGLWVE